MNAGELVTFRASFVKKHPKRAGKVAIIEQIGKQGRTAQISVEAVDVDGNPCTSLEWIFLCNIKAA
jgi:hypothetical protein